MLREALDDALSSIPEGFSIDYSWNVGDGKFGGAINISASSSGITGFVGVGWGIGNGHSLTVNRNWGDMTNENGAGIQIAGNSSTSAIGPGGAFSAYWGTNGTNASAGAGLGLGTGASLTLGASGTLYEPCNPGG